MQAGVPELADVPERERAENLDLPLPGATDKRRPLRAAARDRRRRPAAGARVRAPARRAGRAERASPRAKQRSSLAGGEPARGLPIAPPALAAEEQQPQPDAGEQHP